MSINDDPFKHLPNNVSAEIISKLSNDEALSFIKTYPHYQNNERLWLDVITLKNINKSKENLLTYYNIYINHVMIDNNIIMVEVKEITVFNSRNLLPIIARNMDSLLKGISGFLLEYIGLEYGYSPRYDGLLMFPIHKYLSDEGYTLDYIRNMVKDGKCDEDGNLIITLLPDYKRLKQLVFQFIKDNLVDSKLNIIFKGVEYQFRVKHITIL